MNTPRSLDGAAYQAERAAVGPAADYLERLAALLRGRASVSAVFGEPVEASGVTVIPVARVRFAIGGGLGQTDGLNQGGDGQGGSGEGGGGGGAAAATPIGYLEIRDGNTTFRPIYRPAGELLRPAVIILALGIARRAIARARRRSG